MRDNSRNLKNLYFFLMVIPNDYHNRETVTIHVFKINSGRKQILYEKRMKQRKATEEIFTSKKKFVILDTPTGFGKTYIILAVVKSSNGGALIFVPNIDIAEVFFSAHLELEATKEDGETSPLLCFLLGKSKKSPYTMCPPGQKENIRRKTEISIFDYCDANKLRCPLYNALYIVDDRGLTVRPDAKKEMTRLLKDDINSSRGYSRELDIKEVVDKIRKLPIEYCPYCFIKEMAKMVINKGGTVICDYNYMIWGEFLHGFDIGKEAIASIDEFGNFLRKVMSQSHSEISTKNIKRDNKKIKKALNGIPKKEQVESEKWFSYSILACVLSYINKKGTELTTLTPEVEIYFNGEIEEDKVLIQLLEVFNALKKNHRSFFDDRIENGRDELSKILRFLNNRNILSDSKDGDAVTFVAKNEEDEEDLLLVREPLMPRQFFKKIRSRYRKIICASATPPLKEILDLYLGENNYMHYRIEGEKKKLKIINVVDPDFNYEHKHIDDNFEKGTDKIAEMVRGLNEKAIVNYLKSRKVLTENQERMKIFKKCFQNIKVVVNLPSTLKENIKKMNEYYDYTVDKKAMVVVSAFSRYAEGINLDNEKCRIMIITGIPKPPKQPKIVIKRMNELLKNAPFTYNTLRYVIEVGNRLSQMAGRGIRNTKDWCCIIVLSHEPIANTWKKSEVKIEEVDDIEKAVVLANTFCEQMRRDEQQREEQ